MYTLSNDHRFIQCIHRYVTVTPQNVLLKNTRNFDVRQALNVQNGAPRGLRDLGRMAIYF